MKEIKLDTTQEIKFANEWLSTLNTVSGKIFSNSMFTRTLPMSDKLLFVKEMVQARTTLWKIIEDTYPEIKGKVYGVSHSYITYKEEEGTVRQELEPLPDGIIR